MNGSGLHLRSTVRAKATPFANEVVSCESTIIDPLPSIRENCLSSLTLHVLSAIGDWEHEQGIDVLPDEVVFQQALSALNALGYSRVELSHGMKS